MEKIEKAKKKGQRKTTTLSHKFEPVNITGLHSIMALQEQATGGEPAASNAHTSYCLICSTRAPELLAKRCARRHTAIKHQAKQQQALRKTNESSTHALQGWTAAGPNFGTQALSFHKPIPGFLVKAGSWVLGRTAGSPSASLNLAACTCSGSTAPCSASLKRAACASPPST